MTTPPTSGTPFMVHSKKGILRINAPRLQITSKGWPDPKIWARRPGRDPWMRCWPDFDLITGMLAPLTFYRCGVPVMPLRQTLVGEPVERTDGNWASILADYAPVKAFFNNVPERVVKVVSRYHFGQWYALELAARCGSAALDLLASNPALGLALAAHPLFLPERRRLNSGDLSKRLRTRCRTVCEELGFPAGEAIPKILRKVPAELCRVSWLQALRDRLQLPWVRRTLAHLPTINKPILQLLKSGDFESVTPAFLSECANTPESELPVTSPSDILHHASVHSRRWKKRQLPKHYFRSVRQLQRFALEAETQAEGGYAEILSFNFPLPPFPETSEIIPLDTPRLLIEEGEQQCHPMGGYALFVAENERYVYRMTSPERATIWLSREASGWELIELAGAFNHPVSEATKKAVKEWLGSKR